MTFAFSREPLQHLIEKRFSGEWKNLQETVFSMSEQRAEKACLELAIFLRYLDDEEGLSKWVEERTNFSFGRLIMRDGAIEQLKLRDVANKIIHAAAFEWDFSDVAYPAGHPKLVCRSRETEKWEKAEIDVVLLASVCGNLA
jgi:hypothetical protein